MTSTPTISTDDARRVLDAALEAASALGVGVCVAVVDQSGNLKALARMDGASFLTTALATNKAITSAGLGVSTSDFAQFAATNQVVLAGLSAQPNLLILPGGAPIMLDGSVAGAIGVAGGPRGEDAPIAEAGVAALAATPVGV
jgi:glc operon protein GlcG